MIHFSLKTKLICILILLLIVAGASTYTIYHTLAVESEDSVSLPYSDVPVDQRPTSLPQPAGSSGSSDATGTGASQPKAPAAPAVPPPYTLSIPVLSINTRVERVGVNAKGSLAVPKSFSDAGWYGAGPKPGDPGNAVIDGHVNNGLGLDGVFARLKDIQPGTTITVTDINGVAVQFMVRTIELIPFTDDATRVFDSPDNKSHLVLVTCEGVWVPASKTYDKRLVVYADKIE